MCNKPVKITAFVIFIDLRAVHFCFFFNGAGLCQTICVVYTIIYGDQDFPGSPVVENPRSSSRSCRFNPWLGN